MIQNGGTGVGASGDVTGPASSTDNAFARFDSTTGKLIQNSANGPFGTDAGRLGVGLASPAYLAEFEATAANDWAARIRNLSSDRAYGLVIDNANYAGSDGWIFGLRSNGSYRMIARDDGYVGIGNTAPTVELDVTGTAKATTVQNAYGTVKFVLETVDWGDVLAATTLNAQDYYHLVYPTHTFSVGSVQVYCSTLGGDPTNLDFGIYNSGGTKVAGLSAPVLVGSTGFVTLTLSASYSLSANTQYYFGLAGDSSDSQFLIKNNALNSTIANRFALNSTVQSTMPAGTSTANRYWIRALEG